MWYQKNGERSTKINKINKYTERSPTGHSTKILPSTLERALLINGSASNQKLKKQKNVK